MKIHYLLFSLLIIVSITLFYYFTFLDFRSIFFTLTFGIIFIFGYKTKINDEALDIFRPYFITSVLLYLYSMAGILFVEITSLNVYGEFVTEQSLTVFVFASLLTQLGISLGYIFHFKSYASSLTSTESDLKNNAETKFLIFFSILFSIIFFSFIYKGFLPSEALSYTEWSLQSRVDRMSSNSSGIKEVLFQTTPTILLLCALIHFLFTPKYNFLLRIFSLILLILYLYTQLISGARANLMITMLLIGTFINYKVYKFKPFEMILGGLFIYILINLISVLRVTSDPLEMLYLVGEQFDVSGLAFLSLQRSSELLTSLNAITIIDGIESGATEFFNGTLLINQILTFIPGFIWPGRPPFASVLFVQHFYPGIYEIGGGYGFSVVAEGYWEYGLIGCIIYGFITGFLGERIYQLFISLKNRDIYIFFYALIFTRLVVLIHRSGLFASIKAALIVSIPIILIILSFNIYNFFRKKI